MSPPVSLPPSLEDATRSSGGEAPPSLRQGRDKGKNTGNATHDSHPPAPSHTPISGDTPAAACAGGGGGSADTKILPLGGLVVDRLPARAPGLEAVRQLLDSLLAADGGAEDAGKEKEGGGGSCPPRRITHARKPMGQHLSPTIFMHLVGISNTGESAEIPSQAPTTSLATEQSRSRASANAPAPIGNSSVPDTSSSDNQKVSNKKKKTEVSLQALTTVATPTVGNKKTTEEPLQAPGAPRPSSREEDGESCSTQGASRLTVRTQVDIGEIPQVSPVTTGSPPHLPSTSSVLYPLPHRAPGHPSVSTKGSAPSLNHSNLPPSLSSPAPSHFSPHSGNDDDKGDGTILQSDSVDQKDVHIKHEPLGQDVLVGGFVGNGTTKDPYPLISMSSAVATPSNLGQLTPQIPLCARVQRSSLRLMRDRYSSVGHLCVVIREVLMQLCKETSNSVDGVAVKWEAAIDGNVLALCKFPLGFQPEQRSQLMLTSPTHHQFNKCGRVTHYEDGYTAVYVEDCVALKLDGFPSSLTTTACPDVDVYARALEGVRRFDAEDECMDVQIRAKFLGVVVPQYLVAPTRLVRSRMVGGTSPLNPMQAAAVNAAQGSFTLIRGPPGTGKSSVSACIIQSWLKGHSGAPCTIVSAQQNKAVDRIAIELLKHGVKLVRVMARQAYCDPLLAAVTLDSLSHTQESDREEMRRLLALRQVQGALPVKLHQKLLHLQREAKKATIAALEGCDVVCCTCSTALDPRLSHLRFRNVLIDEATQVPEFELLMPCTMGCVRLALVGDPAQLGPYVGNQGSVRERTGVGVSTFERLLRMGEPSHLLDIQYRMHPSIAQHPSTEFYGGSLHSAPGLGERCRPFSCSLWVLGR